MAIFGKKTTEKKVENKEKKDKAPVEGEIKKPVKKEAKKKPAKKKTNTPVKEKKAKKPTSDAGAKLTKAPGRVIITPFITEKDTPYPKKGKG